MLASLWGRNEPQQCFVLNANVDDNASMLMFNKFNIYHVHHLSLAIWITMLTISTKNLRVVCH